MKRAALLLLAASACTTVGPDYQSPDSAVPGQYSSPSPSSGHAELAHWWTAFGDEMLNRLVEQSRAQNLDIDLASARIREARSLEREAGSQGAPTLAAEASVVRQRISENAIPVPPGAGSGGGGLGLPGEEFTSWRAGFDAGWEIDLFGRNRRQREASAARTGAAIWVRRDAELRVAAEVARTYFELRGLQEQIGNAVLERDRSLRLEQLVAAQNKAGLVNGQEVALKRAERSAAEAAIPGLEAQARARIHALGILAGQTPGALLDQLSTPAPLPAVPEVPPGIPSDLLKRRPDIRAAERELAAATADIGVAVADLYPRISLTAAPALVSTALGSLLEWGSRSFSAGLALDWPILDGGRRHARIALRNARQEQAMIAYRKTILSALGDVEDALTDIEAGRRAISALEQARTAAARAEEISVARHRGGLVTLAEALSARQRRLSLDEQIIARRMDLARDTVALVKALGGGWQEQGQ